MGLKKIGESYCTVSRGSIYDEFDVSEMGEMVLFKAIERYFKTGEIACEIMDLLKMEWDRVDLKKRDIKEIEAAYKQIAVRCIEKLTAHIA